jgi:hypothetical protein
MQTSDKNVATLVFPQEYMHYLNSVAGVSTQQIHYLKRRFVSKSGWEMVQIPMTDCAGIAYKTDIPLTRIIFGGLLALIILGVLIGLGLYWDDLEPGQRVPIGAIALAGVYAIRLLLGARRHSLVFRLHDGSKLKWSSRAGEFKTMKPMVDDVVAFAESTARLQK